MRRNAMKSVRKFYALTWILAMLSDMPNLPDNYGFLTEFSHVVSKAVRYTAMDSGGKFRVQPLGGKSDEKIASF